MSVLLNEHITEIHLMYIYIIDNIFLNPICKYTDF